MDGQELLEQEAAFEASFRGEELPASAAPAVVETPAAVVVPEVITETPAAETTAPANTEATPPAAAPAEDEDPVVFDGFRRSEVKQLFERVAKVPDLELQLRKAHGKIGQLSTQIQTQTTAQPAPTPQAPAQTDPKLVQFQQDFPDITEYVDAVIKLKQPQPQAATPAAEQAPVATEHAHANTGPDPMAIELAVMDRMHKGWRDTVQSQDFNLWLGAQSQDVQQEFGEADTADRLTAVIGQFSQWSTAKTEAANKAAKGQQRLQAAVTPTGQAQRPTAEPTEEEAFEAAFRAK